MVAAGIYLQRVKGDQYARVNPDSLGVCGENGKPLITLINWWPMEIRSAVTLFFGIIPDDNGKNTLTTRTLDTARVAARQPNIFRPFDGFGAASSALAAIAKTPRDGWARTPKCPVENPPRDLSLSYDGSHITSSNLALTVQVENSAIKGCDEVEAATDVYVVNNVTGKRGDEVAQFPSTEVAVDARAQPAVNATLLLQSPRLWGPRRSQEPHLYVAVTQIRQNGKTAALALVQICSNMNLKIFV
ncbi:hypothetical protein B0T24DRAFT_717192 [Lasiosphaeria ovina]|uniref:Glycoside hydrolase family 2 immunoglobulin-like beta-sandwich domain-containing protein n=1 Tax=Lasiosphaeria ovina TaxID=92902 RepID=A0AAE0NDY6_9PEZI|nr:hypothetical protein B0T24DRAFT_717192 [Lasiosphaeria ovina]